MYGKILQLARNTVLVLLLLLLLLLLSLSSSSSSSPLCRVFILIFLRHYYYYYYYYYYLWTWRYFDLCTVYCILGQQHLNTKGERFICKHLKKKTWQIYRPSAGNLCHHHHHVSEGLGMLSCSLILKMKLVPPSLPQSSYVSSSFWFIL